MVTVSKYIILLFLAGIAFSSCQPSKKVHKERLYLQGIDSNLLKTVVVIEPMIQKTDKLSILVYSDNAAANGFYNQVQGGGGSALLGTSNTGGSGNFSAGYLVDEEGNILMSGLGPIHAEGLTKQQLRQVILQKLDTLLKHPYVDIRFLNKRITMLGEVGRPGTINIPEERLNLLDAIALSGDLTVFARKDNILVVREENGKRTMGRLNIKDPAIYKSDFFYLHKDDMVYIEPTRKKPAGDDQTLLRNISIAGSLISTIAIVYSIFKRN